MKRCQAPPLLEAIHDHLNDVGIKCDFPTGEDLDNLDFIEDFYLTIPPHQHGFYQVQVHLLSETVADVTYYNWDRQVPLERQQIDMNDPNSFDFLDVAVIAGAEVEAHIDCELESYQHGIHEWGDKNFLLRKIAELSILLYKLHNRVEELESKVEYE